MRGPGPAAWVPHGIPYLAQQCYLCNKISLLVTGLYESRVNHCGQPPLSNSISLPMILDL